MFLGTFTQKLLAKGQIVLPAKIRGSLGGDRAILTTGFDQCVYGFSVADWNKLAEQELVKPVSTDEGRKIRQKIFAGAIEVELDDIGRCVVPEYLRTYAGLSDQLVTIGAGDHFEIWNSKNWDVIKQGL